jgi:predicted nucleotidyltransferase
LRPVFTGRSAFQGGRSGQDLGQSCDRSLGGYPRAGYRERVLDDALIAEAGRRLSEAAPPSSRVILFGSAARGELTRDSDLDFLVIEPEVENPALESVRLRRVLADVLVPMDIIVASEHRVQEWRDVRGSLIHAAVTGGRELVA